MGGLRSPPAPVNVGVLDIDVHFGNGVEDILKGREGYRYCGIHQTGAYPGSEGEKERAGNILKIGMPKGTGGREWMKEVKRGMEWLKEGGMEMLIVSCGYDGLSGDPLGGIRAGTQGL